MSDLAPRIGRLGWIQIDSTDPERLAAFWTVVLGVGIEGRLGSPPQFVNLHKQYPDAPFVSFQRVPEPKVVKNRVHMDIVVDDIEIATSRIVELGGRRRRPDADFNEYGFCWRCSAVGLQRPGPTRSRRAAVRNRIQCSRRSDPRAG